MKKSVSQGGTHHHQNISSQTTISTSGYVELIAYAVLFLTLVTSIFVVNIFLSRQSNEDAAQVYCATRQQRAWQKAQKNLSQTHIAFYTQLPIDSTVREYAAAIRGFDRLNDILKVGGRLMLDEDSVQIAPVVEAQALSALQRLENLWAPARKDLLTLAASATVTDTALLERSLEHTVRRDDAILDASENLIVTLQRTSNERIGQLQTIQVVALVLSLMVFAAMAIRLAVSLRRRDSVIRRNTEEILQQRNQLATEKERVEHLLDDLKNTQSQLIQSEKMASLGQMVAGIAHEVNTPLGFVMNNISIVERNHGILAAALADYRSLDNMLRTGALESLESMLESIAEQMERIEEFELVARTQSTLAESTIGLERIQELITNLKNFSRLDEADVKSVNINDNIDSALMIAANIVKYKADVMKDYAPNLVAECYPAQLNQVFLNLITNAAQAIKERGVIAIKTFTDQSDAVIKISDTGSGIAPENLKKIFEPFFTTKPVGQGTGLGLSIVYKIIERHNGNIDVESVVGSGTTFTIRIPLRQPRKDKSLISGNGSTAIYNIHG
jgi:signal transduction histidine kinase